MIVTADLTTPFLYIFIMHNISGLDENIDAYLQEWSEWVRERNQWIGDVEEWDQHLRQLILLIHELDNALPYEQQRLSDHLDAIHEYLATLESHGKRLNQLKFSVEKDSKVMELIPDIKKEHSKLRYAHARVRDTHVGLRHQHHEAMDRVNDLLGEFNERVERS